MEMRSVVLLAVTALCAVLAQTPAPGPPLNLNCLHEYGIDNRPESQRALNIREQRDDYEYVRLSRHHIVPYATMRDFHNQLLLRGNLAGYNRLFNEVIYVAANNVGMLLTIGRITYDLLNLPELPQVALQRMRGDPNRDPVQLIHEVYAWLPFNIYVGPRPTDRVDDDRGNVFDQSARYLVGSLRAEQLRRLHSEMVRFVNDINANNADAAIDIMADLVHIAQRPHDFNPSQWLVVQGVDEYHFTVQGNPPGRLLYRQLRPDDYCNTNGEEAYRRYMEHRDRRSALRHQCIDRSSTTGVDTFCMNTLDFVRANMNRGSKPDVPHQHSVDLTAAGWILHILTLGLWP